MWCMVCKTQLKRRRVELAHGRIRSECVIKSKDSTRGTSIVENPTHGGLVSRHTASASSLLLPKLHAEPFGKQEHSRSRRWERRVWTAHLPCLNPLQKKDMKLWYRCPPYTESPACCEERTYHAALSSFKMRRVGFGKGECSPGVFRLRCQRLRILLA